MSILAETLAVNSSAYAKERVNAELIGVKAYKSYRNALETAHTNAYKWAFYTQKSALVADDVAKKEAKTAKTAVYDAVKLIITMIGEVNGDTIATEKVVELVISKSWKYKIIATSADMAEALDTQKKTRKLYKDNPTVENNTAVELATEKVNELFKIEGNARRIVDKSAFGTFRTEFEHMLGDIINGQLMRDPSEIEAEKEARRKARAERAKARRAAKKAAK